MKESGDLLPYSQSDVVILCCAHFLCTLCVVVVSCWCEMLGDVGCGTVYVIPWCLVFVVCVVAIVMLCYGEVCYCVCLCVYVFMLYVVCVYMCVVLPIRVCRELWRMDADMEKKLTSVTEVFRKAERNLVYTMDKVGAGPMLWGCALFFS